MWFKTDEEKIPQGVINMDFFKVSVTSTDSQFQLTIDGQDRKFVFKTETSDVAENWHKSLDIHISASEGQTKGGEKNLTGGIKKPWKFDCLSEDQFTGSADTGDILLFRSNHAMTGITRAYSKSHFDHVAMCLKFETDPSEIFLIEATGNYGVGINRWSSLKEFIGPKQFYDKCVFRHIEMDRPDQMIEQLEKFLSEAVGKKYGLTVGKLTR